MFNTFVNHQIIRLCIKIDAACSPKVKNKFLVLDHFLDGMEEQMRDIFLVLIHDITEEIKKDDVEKNSSSKITKIVQKMDKTFEENFEKESESLIHFENSEIEIQQEKIECTDKGSPWDGMGSISPEKKNPISL